jgi:hypothetical protein
MSKTLSMAAIVAVPWLLVAAAGVAHAGVAVSPLKQEVTVKPGESGKVVISLSNRRRGEFDPPQSVRLHIADVRVSEDGSLAFPEAGLMDHSCAKWVVLRKASLTLGPDQSEQIECAIVPPTSASPGEYYAALVVTLDTANGADRGVVVQYRIASGIFVTIPGRTFPRQAKVERCEFLWPEESEIAAASAAASQPIASPASRPVVPMPKVSVLLRNTGRARFDASGKVTIVDARSRVVFSGPLTSKRACVFGGDSRLFEASLVKPLAAGQYVIKVEMDYESTWSKARYRLPVEILPLQASAFAQLGRRSQEGQPPIDVTPERIAIALHAGSMRSLGLSARNTSDGPLHATAAVAASDAPSAAGWMTVGPGDFTISQAGRRTVELKLRVPEGTAAGTYVSAITIKAAAEGAAPLERTIPVEIEVKAEK